jgi:hypothetical protein
VAQRSYHKTEYAKTQVPILARPFLFAAWGKQSVCLWNPNLSPDPGDETTFVFRACTVSGLIFHIDQVMSSEIAALTARVCGGWQSPRRN